MFFNLRQCSGEGFGFVGVVGGLIDLWFAFGFCHDGVLFAVGFGWFCAIGERIIGTDAPLYHSLKSACGFCYKNQMNGEKQGVGVVIPLLVRCFVGW